MSEEKKQNKVYEVVEVPTEMGLAIRTPEDKIVNQLDLLVNIANNVEEIKKAVI